MKLQTYCSANQWELHGPVHPHKTPTRELKTFINQIPKINGNSIGSVHPRLKGITSNVFTSPWYGNLCDLHITNNTSYGIFSDSAWIHGHRQKTFNNPNTWYIFTYLIMIPLLNSGPSWILYNISGVEGFSWLLPHSRALIS